MAYRWAIKSDRQSRGIEKEDTEIIQKFLWFDDALCLLLVVFYVSEGKEVKIILALVII